MPCKESNRGRPFWAPDPSEGGESVTPIHDHYNLDILPLSVYSDALAELQATRADVERYMGTLDQPIPLTQAGVVEFGDDMLCGVYLLIQDELKAARDRLGLLDFEIRRRLAERNATVIGDKDALVLRPGAGRNAYLPEKLELLKKPLGIDAWNEVMRPLVVLTPDKRALNEWAKRGGEIASIIAEAIIETRGEGKLERVKQ